ncbi:MAG: cyclic nucleotide-binding domain-containing protein, partial [Pseudomonadota bacterium]
MELTLESAFSTGGMVGHFAYLLLVVSMLMRRMFLLRIFVILSATIAIAYALFWLKDPIGVFWESLLVVVNAVQLA